VITDKAGTEPLPQSVETCRHWLSGMSGVSDAEINAGLDTVAILRSLGMDEGGCVAALLHCVQNPDLLDDSVLAENCDSTAVTLYRGVVRLARLSSFSRAVDQSVNREANEDNLRKMLITMVDDVRVVMIKLADQLRQLRAARQGPLAEQQALSRMTLDIYAPLANRLGIWQVKWELEDLALRFLEPDTYRHLASLLDEKRGDREQYIDQLIGTLSQSLQSAGIEATINGRPKHLYSIWKKMQRKGLAFENLWDIRAVRIVVESIADCYSALGVVHTQWQPLPGEFDDYIATPKANGYRSIHTVVIGPRDKSVEVQIRTSGMHQENELGVAAHWRYKENRRRDDSIDHKVVWLRQLLEWKQELEESESLADALQTSVEARRVYVFTPHGTVVDLPEGSTPVDFAYAIHSEVGHSTRGARVNGRMVPLGYQLRTGDQVQIQTQKGGSPSRDWLRPELEYIRTQRARSRIQHWFKQKNQDHHIAEGRVLLEKELSRLGLEDLAYERITAHTPYARPDDLLVALGAGDYKLSRALSPFRREIERRSEPVVPIRRQHKEDVSGSFRVNGVGNLLTTMGRCCRPVPGDPIVGYITSGRGVTIHNQNCNNVTSLSEERSNRLIDVEWGREDSTAYPVEVAVTAYHRGGILHDITQVIRDQGIELTSVNMDTDAENIIHLSLRLEVAGLKTLSKALGQLSRVQNVLEVRRQRR
jgi:GTP pyrophosphokinase